MVLLDHVAKFIKIVNVFRHEYPHVKRVGLEPLLHFIRLLRAVLVDIRLFLPSLQRNLSQKWEKIVQWIPRSACSCCCKIEVSASKAGSPAKELGSLPLLLGSCLCPLSCGRLNPEWWEAKTAWASHTHHQIAVRAERDGRAAKFLQVPILSGRIS